MKTSDKDNLKRLIKKLKKDKSKLSRLQEEIEENVVDELKEIAKHTKAGGERFKKAIHLLYWEGIDLIPTSWIEEAFEIRPVEIYRSIEDFPFTKCGWCGEVLGVSSRSQLKELQTILKKDPDSGWLCSECSKKQSRETEKESRSWRRKNESRLKKLKTMTYRDYLKTPEWKKRRDQQLKSVRYHCQLCNCQDKKLHVHHRSYERRGEELFKDLTVLCEDCHSLYHQSGVLKTNKQSVL